MSNLMFIDGNSIGYASQNSTKLTAGRREVQAIFGFLKTLRKLRGDYPSYNPLTLWDGHSQWRYDLYPDYKANRDKDPKMAAMREVYKEQRPDIMRALSLLGVRQLSCEVAEADDMAGLMTVKAVDAGSNVLLVSGDKDWVQLVGERCVWHDPIRERSCSLDNFVEFTNYADPWQFVQGKALVGDNSDTIKGVGGIGEKTAPDFLLQYGSVENFFKLADEDKLGKLTKAYSRFANNEQFEYRGNVYPPMRDAYYRNLKLMDLRNVPQPDPKTVNVDRGQFDADGFMEFCEELNFLSIIRDFDNWVRPFKR